jgi:hypothetical protein
MVFLSAWQGRFTHAPFERHLTMRRTGEVIVVAWLGLLMALPAQAWDGTSGLRRPPAYSGRVQREVPVTKPVPVSIATQVSPPQDANEPLFHDLPPSDAGPGTHAVPALPSSSAHPAVDRAKPLAQGSRAAAPVRQAAVQREAYIGPRASKRVVRNNAARGAEAELAARKPGVKTSRPKTPRAHKSSVAHQAGKPSERASMGVAQKKRTAVLRSKTR